MTKRQTTNLSVSPGPPRPTVTSGEVDFRTFWVHFLFITLTFTLEKRLFYFLPRSPFYDLLHLFSPMFSSLPPPLFPPLAPPSLSQVERVVCLKGFVIAWSLGLSGTVRSPSTWFLRCWYEQLFHITVASTQTSITSQG